MGPFCFLTAQWHTDVPWATSMGAAVPLFLALTEEGLSSPPATIMVGLLFWKPD